MKHYLISAVLFLGIASGSAIAGPIFIDFETDAAGVPITAEVSLLNQYLDFGVVFSAEEDGAPVNPTIQSPAVFFGETAFSGNNFANNQIAGFGPNDFDNRADIFTMSFLSPVSGVSFYVDPNGSRDPTFNAYSASDALLESILVDSSGWTQIAFASTGISRIEGIQPTDSWNFGVDDLRFTTTTSPVPAPATLALIGLGLFGLRLRRKA